MNFNSYFFFIFILFSFTNCKREIVQEEYYIVSKKDSIYKAEKKAGQILTPSIPHESKWYSDVVFIMDSKNKVFIYETETISRNENIDLPYPNYLSLEPENLIAIDSDNFNSFIENNNDIFQIIPNPNNNSHVFFYIASESDTIKNRALNNLWKLLGKTKSRATFLVRRTTEEENILLQYKRNGNEYNPESIDWSNNFYNGKVSPFTKEYEVLETKTHCLRKAKETFKKHVGFIEM